MYTNMHLNRFVRLFNESWVIVHGGLVAFQTGGPSQWGTKLWPIFTFGPGMMFFSCHVRIRYCVMFQMLSLVSADLYLAVLASAAQGGQIPTSSRLSLCVCLGIQLDS